MTDRHALSETFLMRAGWGRATRAALAGDASNRRYERLTAGPDGGCAVLMDASPERGEDVRPFTAIARHLLNLGLSAPRILAEDAENGFLLLEDLGDALFARHIPAHPDEEAELYSTATDALVHLHRHAMPDLTAYDSSEMTRMALLAMEFYQAAAERFDADTANEFRTTFRALLDRYVTGPPVLIQRDYHAENLLWLPDRQGVARVGLLDFQDAMAGHPAYDLVSLMQDARRDVAPEIEAGMIARYVDASGVEARAFRDAYAVLGVQRNLRIVGVFARLCTLSGKPHYLDFMPRVWAHLVNGLEHPALEPVRDLVLRALPPPTPETLQRIRTQCASPVP